MGSPRQPNYANAKAAFHFEDEKHAFRFLEGEGYSAEQIQALVAATHAGLTMAQVMGTVKHWLRNEPRPATPKQRYQAAPVADFTRAIPEKYSTSLNGALKFFAELSNFIEASAQQQMLMSQAQLLLATNPRGEDDRWWDEAHQLAMTSMLSVIELMGREMTYRQMEAVMVLVGQRLPGEDLPLNSSRKSNANSEKPSPRRIPLKDREDAWRKLKAKVASRMLLASLKRLRVAEPSSSVALPEAE